MDQEAKRIMFCPYCGEKVMMDSVYCSKCGAKVTLTENIKESAAQEPSVGTKRFRWDWVFKSSGLIFLALIAYVVILVAILGIRGVEVTENSETIVIAAFLVSLGIFLGSLWSAYLSPGRTIYEPAVGSALVIILLNLLSGNISGILVGWILPFLLGLGGAKVGEGLQNRKQI